MLIVMLLAILADVYAISSLPHGPGGTLNVLAIIVATIVFIVVMPGFYMLQPNQGVAITLFGEYRGTDRSTGLRWTWPWLAKKKISVRANNFISDKIKVNDLRGNPIDMAAQIMWRVVDTAQALFDVDDYKQFVRVQVEAAIRAIGSRYPYDDFEHQEVTLRGNHDQVGAELKSELSPACPSPESPSTSAASPTSLTPQRSRARCFAGSRRRRSSRQANLGRRRGRNGRNGAHDALGEEGRRTRR